jgi:hypothetical protein
VSLSFVVFMCTVSVTCILLFGRNILLRKSQVEMVLDYMKALQSGTGMVKQMIMGAGNTTGTRHYFN